MQHSGLVIALYGPRACGKTWLANMLRLYGGANVVTLTGTVPTGMFDDMLTGTIRVVDCAVCSPDALRMLREQAQALDLGFSAVYMGGVPETWRTDFPASQTFVDIYNEIADGKPDAA